MPAIIDRLISLLGSHPYEVQTDALKAFGFPKGSEIDIIPAAGRVTRPGIYLIHIRKTKRYVLRKITARQILGKVVHAGKVYAWSQLSAVCELRPARNILDAEYLC
jgi:hypothetical protein